ncbi:hypothetical protein [Nocardia sp. NPDC051570]|uniref:hypothetical protein n=1 Tax=Nocardia sp. NPDC051570 TaxID=3364324 RepID=UPI0037A65C11
MSFVQSCTRTAAASTPMIENDRRTTSIAHGNVVVCRSIPGVVAICAGIAAAKGRNPLGWGILGLFFGILTLIVVIVVPRKKS